MLRTLLIASLLCAANASDGVELVLTDGFFRLYAGSSFSVTSVDVLAPATGVPFVDSASDGDSSAQAAYRHRNASQLNDNSDGASAIFEMETIFRRESPDGGGARSAASGGLIFNLLEEVNYEVSGGMISLGPSLRLRSMVSVQDVFGPPSAYEYLEQDYSQDGFGTDVDFSFNNVGEGSEARLIGSRSGVLTPGTYSFIYSFLIASEQVGYGKGTFRLTLTPTVPEPSTCLMLLGTLPIAMARRRT